MNSKLSAHLFLNIFHNHPIILSKQDSSQDLRSALEQKARSAPAGGKPKRARKMKPGQAKTISDLPQLNM